MPILLLGYKLRIPIMRTKSKACILIRMQPYFQTTQELHTQALRVLLRIEDETLVERAKQIIQAQ